MMNLCVLISFIFLAFASVSMVNGQKPSKCCEKYCYEFDNVRPQEEFFSSKTSYFIGKHADLGKDFHVPGKCLVWIVFLWFQQRKKEMVNTLHFFIKVNQN